MTHWTEEYLQQVEDCEQRESRLSEWEQRFIASIRDQLELERPLSRAQITKLDQIWETATERG
jgi:hypothetical protein